MKTVMSLVVLSVACYATADVQKIQYAYDDSPAEYSIVSFTENGSTIQVTVQRSGPYFTNYTKLALDCANRNVRHMGMYTRLERQSEEHPPELTSLISTPHAVFCLKKKKT